jgi:hypothetical protein
MPCLGAAPKRGGSKQQQQINVDQFTLLKRPMDHLGKQIEFHKLVGWLVTKNPLLFYIEYQVLFTAFSRLVYCYT